MAFHLLAGFLVYMALVYVMRYLFASTGGAANHWLWVEILSVLIFAALAVFSVKTSPWFLAVGIALHGLAWDSWHYRNSPYMPDWYIFACLAMDVTLGAYVAARVPAYERASHIDTENKHTRRWSQVSPTLEGSVESLLCGFANGWSATW